VNRFDIPSSVAVAWQDCHDDYRIAILLRYEFPTSPLPQAFKCMLRVDRFALYDGLVLLQEFVQAGLPFSLSLPFGPLRSF